MEIVNLDKLIKEDKTFILNGRQWVMPGNIDVESAFVLMKSVQQATNPEEMAKVVSTVWKIMEPSNPGVKEEEFRKALKIQMLPALVNLLFDKTDDVKYTGQAGKVDESKNGFGACQDQG